MVVAYCDLGKNMKSWFDKQVNNCVGAIVYVLKHSRRRTLRVLEIFYILIWLLFKEVCLICEVSSYVCFSVSSIYVNKIFISNFSLFSKLKNSRLVFFFSSTVYFVSSAIKQVQEIM